MLEPFNEDHLNDVYMIERSSFLRPWSKDQFSSYCGSQLNSKSFVYLKHEHIIGYLMSHKILEEVHLHNIVIHEDYRRKGFGTRMILDFIAILKSQSIKKICLEVKNSNISAIEFYISHNFNAVGERKDYYQDGSNAILMDRVIE